MGVAPLPHQAESPHVLVVDDDRDICKLLNRLLDEHGFRVSTAINAVEAEKALRRGRFDCVVLDIMLPETDGFSLCKTIRATSDVAIIMLTAVHDETDRVIGLEMGADDYLTKPFNPRELVARIKAILRRTRNARLLGSSHHVNGPVRFEQWLFDVRKREVRSVDGRVMLLSEREHDLLRVLVEHPHITLSRDQLADKVQHREWDAQGRGIDMHISRLRHKIEIDPANPALIQTVRNQGYRFSADVSSRDQA